MATDPMRSMQTRPWLCDLRDKIGPENHETKRAQWTMLDMEFVDQRNRCIFFFFFLQNHMHILDKATSSKYTFVYPLLQTVQFVNCAT